MSPQVSPVRLGVLGIVVISLFATLLARLWYLQVLAAPELRAEAQTNGIRVVATEAPRGRILDRNGRILVDNEAVMTVTLDRQVAQQNPDIVDRLAEAIGVDPQEVRARLDDPRFSPFQPAPVADVDLAEVVLLKENSAEFPGVDVLQRAQRRYPHGRLASHVVGYVGQINDRELDPRRDRGYEAGDSIGKSGVELAYESVLRGRSRVEKLQVDRQGTTLGVLGSQEAIPGRDVVLTIDIDVQAATEVALAEGVMAARQRTDDRGRGYVAPAGAAVVLDPRDGSVLAMASFPDYDLVDFVGGISPSLFAELNEPSRAFPLNNRAIQGLYPPASTFKLLTAMAALRHDVIDPAQMVNDRGRYEVGGRVLRNAGGAVFGPVDMAEAITVSSDVYFYGLGEQFWDLRGTLGYGIQTTARDFGMGRPTEVELPFEAEGRVADPDVRQALHEANPVAYPFPEWFTGDNVNMAIGQGESVATPLQIANAYAAFANGGTLYAPRVGAALRDPNLGTETTIEARVLSQVEMDPADRQVVLNGLRGVVNLSRGTAYGAFRGFDLNAFPVAGKTGTGEVPPRQDTALFVGFGPVASPEYVVAVVIEEAGLGSRAAAPVARRIFETLSGQTPEPPAEEPAEPATEVASKPPEPAPGAVSG